MCLRMTSCPALSPSNSGSVRNYKRSRSCDSSSNIDSRIAQAMDLVKTHMLSAVREEVEPLREKIKKLTERNIQLERENHLLRIIAKYQAALSSGQIANHQLAQRSGQITNHQTALTTGQTSNHQDASSGQITNHQTVPRSGQNTNHKTARSSGQITNQHASRSSGQVTNQQTAQSSHQITNQQTTLRSNHDCSQHDIIIPEQSKNFISRRGDYPNTGYFSMNRQLHLNASLKQNVKCV